MRQAILASGAEVITVSLRRQAAARVREGKAFWDYVKDLGKTPCSPILPAVAAPGKR